MFSQESLEETNVPKYKLLYSELDKKHVDQIVGIVNECLDKHRMEKYCCVSIVEKLKSISELDDLGNQFQFCY